MYNEPKGTRFNCFSPPVMVATLGIELAMAIYAVWRYKMTIVTRLITLILLCLASFQTAEYFVCTGSAGNIPSWSRFGFVAISLLPPLGIHLLHVLAGKPKRLLVYTAYASMLAFAGFFLFANGAFFGYECTGNYVIFQIAYIWGGWFTAFYYGWIMISLALGGRWANELATKGNKVRQQLHTVWALIVGWLVFIVPTIIANTIDPKLSRAIPSVMCGFAVLFALILVLYILPRSAKPRA